ncbi:MAG: nucleotidyltransferase family protein [Planctomycetes bacterium]|nr:nucleotidyltransferase family protein [Planctomycetota bacterium]
MTHSAIPAVLLAAGRGRRLGYPKAALEVRGRWMLPLLVHALRRGGAGPVCLVLSPEAQRAIAGFGEHGADLVAVNSDPDAGRTGSLTAGLRALSGAAEALLIHPCDVPLLTGEVVAALVLAWRSSPGKERLLARPVTAAGRGGHPLLVGADRLPRLREYAPGRPLRDLLDEDRRQVLNVPVPGDPGPFLDVNTAEQLRLLENLLEHTPGAEPDPNHPGRE